MGAAEKSHAQSPRRNITAVMLRFAAGSVDVCKMGGIVALHFGTPGGVVVASIPLREFVEKCRGAVDHNLNRLPTIADFADPAETDPLLSPACQPRHCVHDGACTAAWASLMANPAMSAGDAARAAGVSPSWFSKWQSLNHPGELDALRLARGISLRPSNAPRVMTDRPFILKPGGKAL